MRAPRIVLVVNDDPAMRAELVTALARGGFSVEAVPTGEDALARLGRGGIDLLVTDLRLPGIGGLGLIHAMRRAGMELPAVVITEHGTVDDAVAAMKLGAFDFLTAPFSPTDLLNLARWAVAVADPRGGPHPASAERRIPQLGGGLAGLTVRQVERQLILETLARTGNNRTHAARLLGISIRTLRNKLAEYRARGALEPAVATDAWGAG